MMHHYVYGIGTRSQAEALVMGPECDIPRALDGGQIQWQPIDERLVAWFSLVDAELLSSGKLEAPAAAAEAALIHHQVVEWLHSRCALLPFAFGAAFRDRAELCTALRNDLEQWKRRLHFVAGTEEIEIRLELDLECLRAEMIRERLGDQPLATIAAGKRYLIERSVERDLPEHGKKLKESTWRTWDSSLAAEWRRGGLRGLRAKSIRSNGARVYLQEISSQDLSRLADLRNESKAGFRFELSGGWPAYSFTAAANVEWGLIDGEAGGGLEDGL